MPNSKVYRVASRSAETNVRPNPVQHISPNSAPTAGRPDAAERPSSAAAGATEPVTHGKPSCPRRRLQRLVRPRLPRPTTRTMEHAHRPAVAPRQPPRPGSCSAYCWAERPSSAAAGAEEPTTHGKPSCPRRRLQRLVRPQVPPPTPSTIIASRRPSVQRPPRVLAPRAACRTT